MGTAATSANNHQRDNRRRHDRQAQDARTSHRGSASRSRRNVTATAPKIIVNAAQSPMRSRSVACPPGAAVTADSTARATADSTHMYQDRLTMVVWDHCMAPHSTP